MSAVNLLYINRGSHVVNIWAISSLYLLLCGCFIGRVESSQLADKLRSGKVQKIVCYGTSLTSHGPWVEQFRNYLQVEFPRQAEVINSGESGSITRRGLQFVQERVIQHRPDTVLMEYAANEGAPEHNLSPAESRSNLESIIDAIQSALPQCEVVLMVMNSPQEGFYLETRPRWAEYHQNFRTVAAGRNLLLIDMEAEWFRVLAADPRNPALLLPDGMHPTWEGALRVTLPMLVTGLGFEKVDEGSDPQPVDEAPPTPVGPVVVQKTFSYMDARNGVRLKLDSETRVLARIPISTSSESTAHHLAIDPKTGENVYRFIPVGTPEWTIENLVDGDAFQLIGIDYFQENWNFRLPLMNDSASNELAGYAIFQADNESRPVGLVKILRLNPGSDAGQNWVEFPAVSGNPAAHIILPMNRNEFMLEYPWFIRTFSNYYKLRFGANTQP